MADFVAILVPNLVLNGSKILNSKCEYQYNVNTCPQMLQNWFPPAQQQIMDSLDSVIRLINFLETPHCIHVKAASITLKHTRHSQKLNYLLIGFKIYQLCSIIIIIAAISLCIVSNKNDLARCRMLAALLAPYFCCFYLSGNPFMVQLLLATGCQCMQNTVYWIHDEDILSQIFL